MYKVITGMTKSFTPAYPQVLAAQDSPEHARAWQAGFGYDVGFVLMMNPNTNLPAAASL